MSNSYIVAQFAGPFSNRITPSGHKLYSHLHLNQTGHQDQRSLSSTRSPASSPASISRRYRSISYSSSRSHASQRQIQFIMEPTKYQETETNCYNSIANYHPTHTSPEINSPGIFYHDTIEQHFPTLKH